MPPILIAAALLATPDFPGAIQRQLDLEAPPACTICHATDAGGTGTAVKPFGIYLRSRGLQPFDETSLQNALLADSAEHHSSNSSGILDIDALKAGQDPNDPGGAAGPTPQFGCSSSGSASPLLLLALAAWFCTSARYKKSVMGLIRIPDYPVRPSAHPSSSRWRRRERTGEAGALSVVDPAPSQSDGGAGLTVGGRA